MVLVPTKSGRLGLVIDLSMQNQNLAPVTIEMYKLAKVKEVLEPLFSIEFIQIRTRQQEAYHHVSLSQAAKYVCFKVGGRLFYLVVRSACQSHELFGG